MAKGVFALAGAGFVAALFGSWSLRNDIVGAPDGNVWFTEAHTGKIGRVTPAGIITEFLLPDTLSTPQGIIAGPDGDLWFTAVFQGRIGRFAP